MDTAQHVLPVADVALHQGHMVLSRQVVDIAVNLEVTIAGGHLGAGLPDHMLVVEAAVVLQRLDGDDLQPPLLCLFQQLRGPHHGAVVPHDLAAQPALGKASQAAQVHRGLRMAVAGQHAAPPGHQREHMAGTAQVLRPGGRVHALAAGVAPLLRRDAGGGVHMVDGHGEGGAVVVRVDLDHLLQAQPAGHLLAHGGADQALSVHGHEIHVFRGGELGGADHVALVLPVRVVDGDDDVARPQLLQRFLYCAVLIFHISFLLRSRFPLKIPV